MLLARKPLANGGLPNQLWGNRLPVPSGLLFSRAAAESKQESGTQNPRCLQDPEGADFTETQFKKSKQSPGSSFDKSMAFLRAVQSWETVPLPAFFVLLRGFS